MGGGGEGLVENSGYKDFVAGLLAGVATVAVGHPFDTVKVWPIFLLLLLSLLVYHSYLLLSIMVSLVTCSSLIHWQQTIVGVFLSGGQFVNTIYLHICWLVRVGFFLVSWGKFGICFAHMILLRNFSMCITCIREGVHCGIEFDRLNFQKKNLIKSFAFGLQKLFLQHEVLLFITQSSF